MIGLWHVADRRLVTSLRIALGDMTDRRSHTRSAFVVMFVVVITVAATVTATVTTTLTVARNHKESL